MNITRILWSIGAGTVAALSLSIPAFARPATLVAQDSGSRINVRSAPSIEASTPHYGLEGDRVEVLRETVGSDQYLWRYVQFRSGAQGWIRGDLVQYAEGMARYAVLNGNPGDRINVRSDPSTNAPSPHYGLQGDVVQVLTQKTSNGYIWRYVRFPSGAEGWIRGDLLRAMEEGGC